jgi:hypothetical protein
VTKGVGVTAPGYGVCSRFPVVGEVIGIGDEVPAAG